MLRLISAILVLGLASFTAVVLADPPQEAQGRYKATLSGFEEVPSVITPATGEATAMVDSESKSIKIQLNLSALSSDPTAIALQLGQKGVAGNPVTFLCGGVGTKCAAGKSGELEFTVAAKDIAAVLPQGVEAGKLEPVITALDAGVLCINVATQKFVTGEIRGQFDRGFRGNGENNGKDKGDVEGDEDDKDSNGKKKDN